MKPKEAALHVYSAGAVAPPLQEAATIFEERSGIKITLTINKAEKLLAQISESKEGDVFSSGAEYVLDDAEDAGLTAKGSRRSVGYRRSAIIVPKGNPAGIASLSTLGRAGVRIGVSASGCLRGVWDDVASKAGLVEEVRKNIVEHADGCGAVMALVNERKVDAIIGWSAFKKIWPDTCEVVELPRDLQVFRSTCVAIISYSRKPELAQKFINFLTSGEAKRIYQDYGWIHGLPQ